LLWQPLLQLFQDVAEGFGFCSNYESDEGCLTLLNLLTGFEAGSAEAGGRGEWEEGRDYC
ncbi:MAG TPA: hypothetical protein VIX89_06220, partial [Bryobacteraceae bacterium]